MSLDVMGSTPNVFAAVSANGRRIARLRAALRILAPDVVISFMPETNVRTLLALAGARMPVIVTEHSVPDYDRIGPVWRHLRRWLYPHADRLVGVSRGVTDTFDWLPAGKRAVVYNPLDLDELADAPLPSGFPIPDAQTVIGLGRLEHPKGFDLLLEAFARTREAAPEWNLLILGEGSARPALEKSIHRLGLESCATLPGKVAQPGPFLRRAGLLAVPSRYEGFSLAIVEAFACGLPVVAFDCPTGPRELVTPGVNGLLVPPEDAGALAAAMLQLMGDDARRAALAKNAPSSAQRFALDAVIREWERLFAGMGLSVTERAQM